jgi:hypothetical protein
VIPVFESVTNGEIKKEFGYKPSEIVSSGTDLLIKQLQSSYKAATKSLESFLYQIRDDD